MARLLKRLNAIEVTMSRIAVGKSNSAGMIVVWPTDSVMLCNHDR